MAADVSDDRSSSKAGTEKEHYYIVLCGFEAILKMILRDIA
jgi:hypothetical protein